MGYWKKITVIKKRYEQIVSHDSWINLREKTGNIEWIDERVLLNQNNFMVGVNPLDVQSRMYYGLSIAVANPKNNNVYNTQIGIIKVNGGNPHAGLILSLIHI